MHWWLLVLHIRIRSSAKNLETWLVPMWETLLGLGPLLEKMMGHDLAKKLVPYLETQMEPHLARLLAPHLMALLEFLMVALFANLLGYLTEIVLAYDSARRWAKVFVQKLAILMEKLKEIRWFRLLYQLLDYLSQLVVRLENQLVALMENPWIPLLARMMEEGFQVLRGLLLVDVLSQSLAVRSFLRWVFRLVIQLVILSGWVLAQK